MNRNYRFKSLEISQKNSKDGHLHNGTEQSNHGVFEIGETRTINFTLENGSQQNFPYTHYLTAWLGKEENNSVIKIFFATHLVTLRGFCLVDLYKSLREYKVKNIYERNERYLQDVGEGQPFVKEISITWKKEKDESEQHG